MFLELLTEQPALQLGVTAEPAVMSLIFILQKMRETQIVMACLITKRSTKLQSTKLPTS